MSSMFKKTGGPSFKPKVGRRPGPGATPSSQQPSSSASTTRAPTIEPQSEQSTPAPATPAPAIPVPSAAPVPPTPAATQPLAEAIAPAEQAEIVTPETSSLPPTQEPQTSSTQKRAGPTSKTSKSSTSAASVTTPAAKSQVPRASATSRTSEQEEEQSLPTPSSSLDARPQTRSIPEPSQSRLRQIQSDSNTPTITPEPTPQTQHPIVPPTTSSGALAAAIASSSTAPVVATDEAGPSNTAAGSKRQPRKRQPNGEADGEATEENAPPKRKRKYVRKNRTIEEGAEGREGSNEISRRRRRSLTPEDAELQTVDRSTMKVSDLTRDLRIGKKFKHADLIAERARQSRRDARLKKLAETRGADGLLSNEDGSDAANGSRSGTPTVIKSNNGNDAGEGLAGVPQVGPGYQIIDGQIVINQGTLQVDRHGETQDPAEMEEVEEDEFTHLTTSMTYMRPERQMGANYWSDADTEKFYHYLRMFGTDFETISHMFPNKNRRQVKLKFNREERMRPRMLNAAIMVRGQKPVAIDLDEYKAAVSSSAWEEREAIEAEHARLRAEHAEDIARLRADRRAQGLDDGDDLPEPASGADQAAGADGGAAEEEAAVEEDGATAVEA